MKSPYKGKFRVSQKFKGSEHDGLDLVGVDSKNIYSTVDGAVERAGWENANNQKQGFGQYVRIKQSGTKDRYYFGHLSQINVSVGDVVKVGDILGIEGSTGNSTGSHCHYCVRANASKSEIRNINEISGIPNKEGMYNSDDDKTINALANEVIGGLWGNGEERRKKLSDAGYDYDAVQKEVNRLLGNGGKKSDEQIAREVIAGMWGNGAERKKRLKDAGYNSTSIQKIVNKLME